MTPEQAHFLLNEVYIPQIRNEHKTTRRVLEAVPADKLNYSPDPVSMDAWKLATHIASSEIFFIMGVANGAFNRADAALPDSVKTPADLVQWYDEQQAKALDKLASTSGEDLVKNVTFAVFTLPAINYVALMITHSVHHRGQLSAYLRPMGAKVPRIYGGSADEPIDMTQSARQ
jgi:uncharacterized damage-inducible protein DinB